MPRAKRYNWKQMKKRLEAATWEESPKPGKKHTKMVKEGQRPITLPHHKGQTYDVGLSSSILKQAGLDDE